MPCQTTSPGYATDAELYAFRSSIIIILSPLVAVLFSFEEAIKQKEKNLGRGGAVRVKVAVKLILRPAFFTYL